MKLGLMLQVGAGALGDGRTVILAVYGVGTRKCDWTKYIPVFRSPSALTRVKIRSYAFPLVPSDINNLKLVDFVGACLRQYWVRPRTDTSLSIHPLAQAVLSYCGAR